MGACCMVEGAMMLKTIEQSEYFAPPPKRLFEMYMSAEEHGAMTGMPVTLDPRPGGRFKAFGGMLEGTILATVPGRLIVQPLAVDEVPPRGSGFDAGSDV